MTVKLTGSIAVTVDDETIEISAEEFSLEEGEFRNLGEGEKQYEALFIHTSKDKDFVLHIQATNLNGVATAYETTVYEGNAEIEEDNLEAVPT